MAIASADLPTYGELMLPVLRAVRDLGESGSSREIVDRMVELEGFSEQVIGRQYPNRQRPMLFDRANWARSYCKLAGWAAASATPHVDLIDGERLCELMLAKDVGVSRMPVVDLDWFDRFD